MYLSFLSKVPNSEMHSSHSRNPLANIQILHKVVAVFPFRRHIKPWCHNLVMPRHQILSVKRPETTKTMQIGRSTKEIFSFITTSFWLCGGLVVQYWLWMGSQIWGLALGPEKSFFLEPQSSLCFSNGSWKCRSFCILFVATVSLRSLPTAERKKTKRNRWPRKEAFAWRFPSQWLDGS